MFVERSKACSWHFGTEASSKPAIQTYEYCQSNDRNANHATPNCRYQHWNPFMQKHILHTLPKVQTVSSDCSRTEWYKRYVWCRDLNDMYENSTNCKAKLWHHTTCSYRYTTERVAFVHFSCKRLMENHALSLLLLLTMSLKLHTISNKFYGYKDRQLFQYCDKFTLPYLGILLSAVGSTPSGSSAEHIYTQHN